MPQPKGTGKRPGFHQNTHAFKHNKGSKKTQKILRTPNRGLCQKCHDIIEWKKQYRKYKPLVQPRKCNKCDQKNITLAYHVVCDPCAIQHKICAKCQTKDEGGGLVDQQIKRMEDKKEVLKLAEQLAALPLRKQKTILREIDQTEYLQRKERRRMRGEASDSEGEDEDEEEDNEEEEDDDVDDDDREEQQEETEKDNEAEDDDDEEEGEDQEDDEEEDEEDEEEEEEGNDDNDDNDDEFEEIEEVDEDESLMEGKIVMKKVLVRKTK